MPDIRDKLYEIRDKKLIKPNGAFGMPYFDYVTASEDDPMHKEYLDVDIQFLIECLIDHDFDWDMAISDYFVN